MVDTLKPVSELRCGDRVDLEGDKFADRGGNAFLECEYQVVNCVERENPNCIAIGFEGFEMVGFQPDHKVKVRACETVQTAVFQPWEKFSAARRDLAQSLACYTSDDDWGEDRKAFLQSVRDRIDLDLQTGEY